MDGRGVWRGVAALMARVREELAYQAAVAVLVLGAAALLRRLGA